MAHYAVQHSEERHAGQARAECREQGQACVQHQLQVGLAVDVDELHAPQRDEGHDERGRQDLATSTEHRVQHLRAERRRRPPVSAARPSEVQGEKQRNGN